jgi:hypothetical protein
VSRHLEPPTLDTIKVLRAKVADLREQVVNLTTAAAFHFPTRSRVGTALVRAAKSLEKVDAELWNRITK